MKTFLLFEEFISDSTFRNLLLEATKKELLDLGSSSNIESDYDIKYVGFDIKTKRLKFNVGDYLVQVEIPSYKEISKLKGSREEKIKLALSDEIKVNCSCNYFKFGGPKYNNDQLDSGIYKEKRAPEIRDPNNNNFLCKHLKQVLTEIDKIDFK